MQINGKELKMKLDLGALRLLKQQGFNLFGITEEQASDPEFLAVFIQACAYRGGSDITMDDIDTMTARELLTVQGEISNMMQEFMPDPLVESQEEKTQSP